MRQTKDVCQGSRTEMTIETFICSPLYEKLLPYINVHVIQIRNENVNMNSITLKIVRWDVKKILGLL